VSATPRLAATVIVLRPAGAAPEVLMVRRARGASFMADAFVFPGGRVDDSDGLGDEGARRAAVRELAEEVAVVVAADTLVPLSRWITPSAEPKRFDARFFVAAVPAGTEARVDAAEVTEHLWLPAAGVLARHEEGALQLPPPTLRTLEELAPLPTVDAALAWAVARPQDAIQPKLIVGAADAITILLPWDPDYAAAAGEGVPIGPTSPLARGTSRYLLTGGRFWARQPSSGP
jgi:8-oxo-dGTP pyrophosphatase MutT (NUDIX family)